MRSRHSAKLYATSRVSMILLLLLMGSLLSTLPVSGGMSGAIWTTNPQGEQVNGNLYAKPKDVYLVGGPYKEGATGFAEGWYCFQVTDPQGNLLSKDPAEDRTFYVDGNSQITDVVNHNYKELSDGRIIVQLWPFDYNPKTGSAYKIWVTSKANFTEFGFIPAWSKTDNFKVGRWTNDVLKYFELRVTSGVFGLPYVEFYVNYSSDVDGDGPTPPSPWTKVSLLQVPNSDSSSEVLQYDTTFTIGTYVYWKFFVEWETGNWTSDEYSEQIIEAGMVNKLCLFLFSGHKYDSRPTDKVKIPVSGSPVELSMDVEGVFSIVETKNTDVDGYYNFIGVFVEDNPIDYKVSCEDNWFEHVANILGDQVMDFYSHQTYLTGGDVEVIENIAVFDLVFTPSGNNMYKLSQTNPGSFHYMIEHATEETDHPVTIIVDLPPDNEPDSPNFIFHHRYIGDTPVIDIQISSGTGGSVKEAFTITFTENWKHVEIYCEQMPAESIIVAVHIDYQIDGSLTSQQVDDIDDSVYTITTLIINRVWGGRDSFTGKGKKLKD